ncbi:MAG: DUF6623 family protein, partial [Burkholderiaceae bacterium]
QIKSIWRAGFFSRLIGKSGGSCWVHFAVPTPVIVEDGRLSLESALIRFRTTPGDAWIAAVHIFDGEKKIAAHDRLRDATSSEWKVNRYAIRGAPKIEWGVGISVNVQFHIDALEPGWQIDFCSVGCDFRR